MPDRSEETIKVGEFEVPVRLARITGCSPETFESYGNAQFETLQRFLHILRHECVLEIGCGAGRLAIPATRAVAPPGNYLGMDVNRDSIQWCSQNITAKFPHFRFHFENVRSPLHNPGGTGDPASTKIPLPDASVDKIFLSSVFTHMLPTGVDNYLREFRRVLKPGGIALSTMFLLNTGSREAIRSGKTPWKFAYNYENAGVCWVNSFSSPEAVVAYQETRYVTMIRNRGMELRRVIECGMWAGLGAAGADGQDYVVFGPAGS